MNVKEQLAKNARGIESFGGRRFLGFTNRGSEVWISYTVDKKSGQIKISTTHNLNVLLNKNSIFATKRVTLKKGVKNRRTAEELIKLNKKNMGGAVTKSTLTYLDKLIDTLARGYGKPFVKGKPSSLMFMYIAQSIYEGSYTPEDGDTTWSAVRKEFNFPDGEYFTVQDLP
jgi:hypothetical protein